MKDFSRTEGHKTMTLKYGLFLCLSFSLGACGFMPLKTPTQQTCKEIAISRLKHKTSYDMISVSEKETTDGQLEVYLNFKAWNDFKVPMAHSISCLFQNTKTSTLLSIKWNGRPIRRHELDDIRKNLQ